MPNVPGSAGESNEPQVDQSTVPGRSMDQGILDEIVRRVVEVAQPERVILFGSAARGEHRGHLEEEIYMNLFGVGAPVDVVVVTAEDVSRFGERVGSVIRPALREGRELYAA